MEKQAGSSDSSSHLRKNRLFPKWFWVLSLSLVFLLSAIWHLPIAPFLKSAPNFLPSEMQNLSFENSQGGLWEGTTQLSLAVANQTAPVDLGRVEWQQPAGDLFSALSPKLLWVTQFGQWQGSIERAWLEDRVALKTDRLQLDIDKFLTWLAPFAQVPFAVKGEVSSQQLNLQWSPKQLVTALEGKVSIHNLASMGVRLPPLTLKLSMPSAESQQIQWQLSGATEQWSLQGTGTLQAKPGQADFGVYQGKLVVKAQSAEQLPDFAHLFRVVSATSAELTFNGNLQQYRK